ncbi:MAG: diadenylate cyclase CdaA [Chloroflexota bacterium]|nr:diadenylate cyclase CdaA [Chloroflexota bacterium]
MIDQLLDLVERIQIQPTALLDIGLTALLIYGLFSLIQGTRAVRLVVGAILLLVVYVAAQAFELRLLSGIMETGAVVGLLALVVIFQPELRRALERIGRVGSLGWVFGNAHQRDSQRVPAVLARTAVTLAAGRIGALIVVERETGLQDTAEAGVMVHADLSPELLHSIFTPHAALHDGAVIVRGERIVAAGVVLPLSETSVHRERFGTRHRAAIGITEQTDALAIVVSEESGSVSLVERGRILRNMDEERLRNALTALLRSTDGLGRAAVSRAVGRGSWDRGSRLRRLRSRRAAAARIAGEAGSGGQSAGGPAGTPRPTAAAPASGGPASHLE